MKPKIIKHSNHLEVEAPYNSLFLKEARDMNGKWDGESKRWKFDARDRDRLKSVLLRIYGEDGEGFVSGKFDAVVRFPEEYRTVRESSIEILGRTIVMTYQRDGQAKQGEGVVIEKGGFKSCGSRRFPQIKVEAGTEIIVRDVPEAFFEEKFSFCSITKKQQSD